ncbi:MAG: NlpC/P60 family protein [Actinomycetota bacterium]|nr:NlpC/P60 family protein [Actinomycetota bacterium]
MRMRRPVLSTALGVTLVGAMVVTLGPLSSAAPRADIQQVQAQVLDLEMQAAAAHERANAATARLAQIQGELGTIQNRQARERDDMRIQQATIEDIARAAYTSGGVDPTLEVLLAENPVEFLAQAAVLGQLEQAQADQLRQARTSRLRLAQTEAEISDRENDAAQVRDELASAQAEAAARLAAAEDVLATLQEAERQRLLELQRERQQQALEEARQAAALAQQQQEQQQQEQQQQQASQGDGQGDVGGGNAESGGGFAGGSRAQAAVQYALSQVGDPYSFSANPPSSWDCSKLTAAAWAQAGVGLTALSYTQWDQTQRVPVSDIQPGDLVFYFGMGAHHVAMYIGNGKMVSASNPSDGVEIIDFLGPWYGERFSGVGRVVG